MVPLAHLLYLDWVLRRIHHNNKPFGGRFVILIGDFFQLQPVKADYIFVNNPLFTRTNYFHVKLLLTESIRQDDKPYSDSLLQLRQPILTL